MPAPTDTEETLRQEPASEPANVQAPARVAVGTDPLARCLELAGRALGRPFDAPTTLAHLPMPASGLLPTALIPRAAAAAGLRARVVARRPTDLSGLYAPFIALLARGDACLVVRVDAAQRLLDIVTPDAPDDVRSVGFDDMEQHATGEVVLVSPADQADAALGSGATAADRVARHWLWGPLASQWSAWLQIALAALMINLLGLALPLYTMTIYDRVIPNLALPTLWALTAGIAIALGFDFILRQLRAVVLDHIGRRIDMSVSAHLFEHIQALTMASRKESSGVVAHRLKEFDTARDFFMSASIIAVIDVLFIGIFIWMLWMIVGTIALVPLVAVILVVVVTLMAQIPLARAVQRTQQHAASRHATLIESLAGVEAIKAAGAEGVMQRRWEQAVAANAKASSAVRFWSQGALNFTSSVQQVVGIAILVWGVYLVADGTITVGGLIAASILAGRVLAPLANIAATLARAQQAFAAVRGVSALMALERDRRTGGAGSHQVADGAIEFREVGFKYPGGQVAALADVSFKIAAGERVGIIGRVGSGKTTIGKLLTQFYAADAGSILVDGNDIRSFDAAALRAGVGFVGQDPELFTGSLSDNIAMGRPSATPAEIQEAARVSGVMRFAAASPLGLATPVGERGRQLSGGQRQAVALARALIRRPRILFLDEPSSAMDVNTEAELIRSLRDWCRNGPTLVVSSHRLPILELIDRLIVLDGGKVVADGPKAKVLAALKGGGEPGR